MPHSRKPQVTIQKGLQKKSADISFLAEVCSAADTESGGRMTSITQKLMKRSREFAFHQYWSRSLPKVSKLELPVIFSKPKRKVGCGSAVSLLFVCFYLNLGGFALQVGLGVSILSLGPQIFLLAAVMLCESSSYDRHVGYVLLCLRDLRSGCCL